MKPKNIPLRTRGRPSCAAGACFLTVLAALAGGCDGAAPKGQATQVEVSLTTSDGSGVTIDTLTWAVLGPTGNVLSAGAADTGDPNALPAVLINVPSGKGEQVSLTATLSNGITCSGTSSSFDVASGQRVTVGVTVMCGTAATNGLGSVLISTDLVPGDKCPVLSDWSVTSSPAQAASDRFDLAVSATDPDQDELSFAWTATSGTFIGAGAATTYSCQAAGAQTIVLSISDNHQPLPCTSLVRFPPVVCP